MGPQLEGILAGKPGVFQADRREVYRHSGEFRQLFYTYSFSPIPDEATPHGVGGVLCMALESTSAVRTRQAKAAQRESEERQFFLLGLSDALRLLADPAAIQGGACRLLAEQLDVDRAYYVEIDDAARLARVERDYVRDAAPSLANVHSVAAFAGSVEPVRRDQHTISRRPPPWCLRQIVRPPWRSGSSAAWFPAHQGGPAGRCALRHGREAPRVEQA